MRFPAISVQKWLLRVPDDTVIAHGYTFDRQTINIFFHDGYLVRHHVEKGTFQVAEVFDPEFFFTDIKRWYLGNQESETQRLNPTLQDWFDTFGRPLPTTKDGFYPITAPQLPHNALMPK